MAEVGIKTRKRKVSIIHESSSSDIEKTPSDNTIDEEVDQLTSQKTPRSSERLQKKRCRAFRKPSRDDVWKKITPSKSPGKYEQLRPKRLVNNFTKENSSYNYDPNETSGDESMNDFLDDSITEQSSSESDKARGRYKQKVRIKGRRRRLQNRSGLEESSSTDSDNEEADTVTKNINEDIIDNDDFLSGDSAICVESGKREMDKVTESDNNVNSDDDTEVVTARKKQNRSIVESDENDISDSDSKKEHSLEVTEATQGDNRLCESDDHPSDSDENIVVTRKHNRSIIESDEEESYGDKNDGNVELQVQCGTSDTVHGKKRLKNTDIVLECEGKSDPPKKIKEKSTKLLSSTQKTSIETTKSALVADPAVLNDSENETSSCESISDSSEESDGSSEDVNDESDDENAGNSSRVRVQMLKKKRDRQKLFEKLRKERQRKLLKEH